MAKGKGKKARNLLTGLSAAYVANEFANPTVIDLGPPLKRDEETKPASVVVPAEVKNRNKDIAADEFMAGSRSYGQGPANAYKRLQEASASGAYASPVLNRGESGNRIPAGDLGQFLKKGGAVSASKRADGCCQRGKTRGKMV